MSADGADRGARVYLEEGSSWVFAVALDWPGWCRRGRGVDAALDELDAYRDRYAAAVTRTFAPGPLEVIGTVPGNRTTDFGAPDARGPWDADPPTGGELERQVGILVDAWASLDAVAAASPEQLAKGPRGGGRDRDAVLDHVREAERAYCPKIGTRVAPRTPWPDQRAVVVDALRAGPSDTPWPVGYAIRRLTWHVLDHAWEIEDKRG
jgi:hypothetical protein